jgi:hypothetical protein
MIENIDILLDHGVTADNAAIYLGLSKKTLALYRWRGIGPKFVKRGKDFSNYGDDLDEWPRSARVSRTADEKACRTT